MDKLLSDWHNGTAVKLHTIVTNLIVDYIGRVIDLGFCSFLNSMFEHIPYVY